MPQPSFAGICLDDRSIFEISLINNVLNLTDEQIKLQNLDIKAFKKCLTRDQRIKYNMIRKLQKDDIKKSHKKKNYYKTNPQLQVFGNPQICPKID